MRFVFSLDQGVKTTIIIVKPDQISADSLRLGYYHDTKLTSQYHQIFTMTFYFFVDRVVVVVFNYKMFFFFFHCENRINEQKEI